MSFATNKVTIIRTHQQQGCSSSSSSAGQRTVTVTKTVTSNTNGQRTITTSSTTTTGSNDSSQHQKKILTATKVPSVTPAAAPATRVGTTTSAATGSSSTFESAVLAEHNRLRAKHSAPPLTLNSEISRYAQEWANHLAARNVLQHRSNNRYGENLYASFGRESISGDDAVRSWYSEIKHYTFGQSNPSNFGQVGHFTQVVWKASRQLGVGMARNGNNIYVVCNYDPPGNFGGRYPANVTRN